jgi:hypothetical protein
MNKTTESLILKAIFDKNKNKSRLLISNFLKEIFNHLFETEYNSKIHSEIPNFSIITDAIYFMLKTDRFNYAPWNTYTEELERCLRDVLFPKRLKISISKIKLYHDTSPLMIKFSNEKLLFKIINKLIDLLNSDQVMEVSDDDDCREKLELIRSFTNLNYQSDVDEYKKFAANFTKSLELLGHVGQLLSVASTNVDEFIQNIKIKIESIFVFIGINSIDDLYNILKQIYELFQINSLNELLKIEYDTIEIGKTFKNLTDNFTFESLNKSNSVIIKETRTVEQSFNLYARIYFMSHLYNVENIDVNNELTCFKSIQTYINSQANNRELMDFKIRTLTLLGGDDLSILENFLKSYGTLNVYLASRQLSILYSKCGNISNITLINNEFSVYYDNFNSSILDSLKDISKLLRDMNVKTIHEAASLINKTCDQANVTNINELYEEFVRFNTQIQNVFENKPSLTEVGEFINSINECQHELINVQGDTFIEKIKHISNNLLGKLNSLCPEISYESLISFLTEISEQFNGLNENVLTNVLKNLKDYTVLSANNEQLKTENISLQDELKECNDNYNIKVNELKTLYNKQDALLNEKKALDDKIYSLNISESESQLKYEKLLNKFDELTKDFSDLEQKHKDLTREYTEAISNRPIAVTFPRKRKKISYPEETERQKSNETDSD